MVEKLNLEELNEMPPTANPIGEVQELKEIDEYVQALAGEWKVEKGETPWWKFWKSSTAATFQATQFLIKSLDGLIIFVDGLIENGADKKATVLQAMDSLYEYVVREAIPIWARPFAGTIKKYVIYTLISTSIDWIVDKYRSGSWRTEEA